MFGKRPQVAPLSPAAARIDPLILVRRIAAQRAANDAAWYAAGGTKD